MEPPIEPQKHSRLGIASFVISLASGILTLVVIVIAGVMEATSPGGINEESAAAIIVGLFIIGFIGLSLLSFCLGIAGLFQRDRKKAFAIVGTIFSACTILGTIGLIIIGSM